MVKPFNFIPMREAVVTYLLDNTDIVFWVVKVNGFSIGYHISDVIHASSLHGYTIAHDEETFCTLSYRKFIHLKSGF